ncbi:hypothetical protein [Novosphingobium sp. BW1]|uniref:hypothetical protein n=1 Tax=Novosphingobium sp. BW1 TaxID=2592621 RepID=UPI0011DEEFE0|nr:hypothetical protein [Novosphingobium sp. BW1]TYC85095.1 hypothetical protein FMM79_18570 [Novosphingobium sp. BW1]
MPDVFRAYAYENLAHEAYMQGDAQLGLAYARKLVARRPYPSAGPALLTQGLAMDGQSEAAIEALIVAATRGWRDFYTQILMVQSSIGVGDGVTASQRLIALWRAGMRDDLTMSLTSQMLQLPGGSEAFVEGLVEADDKVRNDFFRWALDKGLPGAVLVPLGEKVARSQAGVDCGALLSSVRGYGRGGHFRSASGVWAMLCGDNDASRSSDLAFRSKSDPEGPFDWSYPGAPRLEVEPVQSGEGVSLRYENAEHVRAILARRVVALAPGKHTVRVRAEGRDAQIPAALTLQVRCYSAAGERQDTAPISLRHGTVQFEVPEDSCPGQELVLMAGFGSGYVHALELDGSARVPEAQSASKGREG